MAPRMPASMKQAVQKEMLFQAIADIEAIMHALRSLPASTDANIEKQVQARIEEGQEILGNAERALSQAETSASPFLTSALHLKYTMQRIFENDTEALRRERGEYLPQTPPIASSSYSPSYSHRSRKVDRFMGRDGR